MVTAVPSLVGAADGDKDPQPAFDRPEFKGTPPNSSRPASGTIEEYEAKRKAKRNSKDAKDRRKALRKAHKRLSASEARDLAQRTFPTLFGEIPAIGQPRDDEHIKKFVDDFTAIIEDDKGKRGLSVSSLPLRVEGDEGKKKRADLGLVQRGEAFEPEQAMTPIDVDKNPAGGIAFEGTGVTVKPVVDAGAAAGTEVEGRAFFGNVGQDADLLVAATPYGAETFTMLRSEDSPEKQVFTISMPQGARLVLRAIPEDAQDDASGAKQFVEVRNRDDKQIIRVAPPSATDAEGERIPVTYEVGGNRLTVRAAHRDGDYAYPIQVDPLWDVYEDFWSWREYGGAVDFDGWWHSVNANQGCSWGSYQGAVDWNSWHYGLYNWSNQGNFCVDNSWGEWLWRAPRNSKIFRAEFGFMRHWNAYSCIQQGVWDVQNGGWDAPWENGGAPFENCNFPPNEPISDFKTACGDPSCNNWQGSPGNVAVFKLRHMFDGTRSVKPKAYLGGAAFHLQDSDNPVFETINHTPPGGWEEDGYYQLWPRAHDDGVGMAGFEFYAPGHDDDGLDNGCGGARCPGVWEMPGGEPFSYDVLDLPEGVNNLAVRAYDALEKTTDHAFQVRVDRSAPSISRSGAASTANAELGDARYGLHVDATDGSGSDPRSGMKTLEIQVDGRQQGSLIECGGYSCSTDWELMGERYATGKHTISVIAKDQMDHVSREDWEVTVSHAASAGVGPGAVNLKTGSLTIAETDTSVDTMGEGLAVSRTYNSRDPAGGANGVFGPGWVAGLPVDGPTSNFVSLTAADDNTVEVATADGSNLAFTRNEAGAFVPPEGLEDLKLTRHDVVDSKVAAWRLNELPAIDDFTTLGGWSFDTGAGTLNASGGELVPTDTSEKRLTQIGSYTDAQVTLKFKTGASFPDAGLGLVLRRGDASNWLSGGVTPNGFLFLRKSDAGTQSNLTSSLPFGALAANTTYWVRFAAAGNVVSVRLYSADPASGAAAVQTMSYTLGGADAAKFGSGVSGSAGIRTVSVPTDYRYDSYQVESLTADDATGSNDGTYTGGFTLGEPGATTDGDKAVKLDGSSGHVSVPHSAALNFSTALTVEAWVRPADQTPNQWRKVVAKGLPTYSWPHNEFALSVNAGPAATASFQITTGGNRSDVLGTSTLPTDRYSHLIGTWDGTTMRIYVDGALQGSTAKSGTLDNHNQALEIGRLLGNNYVNGWVDDVALYSRALSASEVARLANASVDSWELSDLDGNVTVFERTAGTSAYVAKRVREAGSNTTSRFEYDSQGRLSRATAPAPAGVDCASLVRGCRALTFTYASSTTATGTSHGTFGDFNGRLARVDLTAYDPATLAMATGAVAQFAYDNDGGRLREAWDPRISPALKTSYAYDSSGHMTSLTPPGQEAWTMAYGPISGDPDTGRMRSASRAALPGIATTTLAYKVPLSGSGAPYSMSSPSVAAWGQTDVPAEATAIFPPDQVPADPPGSYSRAAVHYLDSEGRAVNVAAPGGRISTTEYEAHDKVRRSLTAGNRERALAAGGSSASRSQELDTQYAYNSDATELTQELGPMHSVELGNGQVVNNARKYTRTAYDEGAPSGGPYHLPTTIRAGARVGGSDFDERTTKVGYDDQANLGWTLRQPTSKTTDPNGLNLKNVTLYDSATGQVTETRMPANPNGGDARSTQTVYYSAAANGSDPDCGNRPEFAGLPCRTRPAAQPGTPGLPNLPVTTTSYNRLNQPVAETEIAGSATRTTTTTYDAAGRTTSEGVTASEGTPVPATTTVYNASNGAPSTLSATEGGITRTITKAFDTLGRVTSYTDADGNTSTNTYDVLGRPSTSNDGKGTQTRTYDATTGDLTQLQDSSVGTFTATYDADGQLLTQDLPNGLRQRNTYDETGQLKQTKYDKVTNCSANCTWLDFTGTKSIQDQWVTNTGSLTQRRYSYDSAGRLTRATDTIGSACRVRDYGFDANSNRTSQATHDPGPGGACDPSAPGSFATHAYDAADRLVDSGTVYDGFGRISALSEQNGGGAVAMTYYADDATASVNQDGTTSTYNRDPAGRQRQRQVVGQAGQTQTYHYSDDSDNPSWFTQQSDGLRWTRVINGIDGDVIGHHDSAWGTSFALRNLHGDHVAHTNDNPNATGPTYYLGVDEYGNPQGQSALTYAWLGAKGRRTQTPKGIVQMGVRTYVPAVGRFTAVDPVPGGSANAYDYAAADPVNNVDLDGRKCRVYAGRPLVRKPETHKRSVWGRARLSQGCADKDKIFSIRICVAAKGAIVGARWQLVAETCQAGFSGVGGDGADHLGHPVESLDCRDHGMRGALFRTWVWKQYSGDPDDGAWVKGKRGVRLCDGKRL